MISSFFSGLSPPLSSFGKQARNTNLGTFKQLWSKQLWGGRSGVISELQKQRLARFTIQRIRTLRNFMWVDFRGISVLSGIGMRTDSCHTWKSKTISLTRFGENWELSSSRNLWRWCLQGCNSELRCDSNLICKLSRLYESRWTRSEIAYTWLNSIWWTRSEIAYMLLQSAQAKSRGEDVANGRILRGQDYWQDLVLSRIRIGPGKNAWPRWQFDRAHRVGNTEIFPSSETGFLKWYIFSPTDFHFFSTKITFSPDPLCFSPSHRGRRWGTRQ